MFLAISANQPFGFSFSSFLISAKKTSSSSEPGLSRNAASPCSARRPLMHQHGGVAAVVEDHVGGAAAVPVEQLGGVVPVFVQALALQGEDRDAGGGDRGGGVVLGRIDVAGDPADVGAERRQRLDQHRGLDRHVQRAGDARALQRLLGAVFLARRHQAGHLGLGERDFLAAEFGERDVLDDVVGEGGLLGGGGHVVFLCLRPSDVSCETGLQLVVVMPGLVPGIHVLAAT